MIKKEYLPQRTQDGFGKFDDDWISNRSMTDEWNAWRKMFQIMTEILSISEEELNKPKYRRIFAQIERWAYFDRLRRETLRNVGNKFADDKGIFWNGEN